MLCACSVWCGNGCCNTHCNFHRNARAVGAMTFLPAGTQRVKLPSPFSAFLWCYTAAMLTEPSSPSPIFSRKKKSSLQGRSHRSTNSNTKRSTFTAAPTLVLLRATGARLILLPPLSVRRGLAAPVPVHVCKNANTCWREYQSMPAGTAV